MRKSIIVCAVIASLAIVFVGAIRVYLLKFGATWATAEGPAEHDNAELVSIIAGRDSSIFSESDNSGGAASTLLSGHNNRGGSRRALLWFNVAGSIPAGSTINSAELTLHLSGVAQTETMAREFSLYKLLSAWGEGTSGIGGPGNGRGATPTRRGVTWNYRIYDTDSWTSSGGDFEVAASATTSIDSEIGFYAWGSKPHLVDDVQGWLDHPSTNFGWILIGSEPINGTARRFDSREATEAQRPLLQVQFTAAP